MKTVAIIQARMRSSRLPGKVILPLANKSVLWWIVTRIKQAKMVDEIIIATTTHKSNNDIIKKGNIPAGCAFFRYDGDENDVIGRVIACAEWAKADIIVDITGDCPLIDPAHIEYLLYHVLTYGYDYASNCVDRSWPDGLDIQVYKTHILKEVKDRFNPVHHAGWNIAQHPKEFKIYSWLAPIFMHWPELGLTLDTPEDYELLKIIFNQFNGDVSFAAENVVMFLRNNPALLEINKKIKRKTPEEG